ncbi:MAG: HAMP domain-containing sensor histidine kinase [Acidimicrobiales bacterium]|jgi:signal transduction histidine kinase
MRRTPAAQARDIGSAVRVAIVATLVVILIYAVAVAFLDLFVSHRLVGQVDRQLSSRLDAARVRPPALATREPNAAGGGPDYGVGIYGEPIYVWEIPDGATVATVDPTVPLLPSGRWPLIGQGPVTRTIADTQYRLLSTQYRGGLLVAGEDLTELSHVESVLLISELVAAPVLLVAIFLASVLIGLRSARPIELARRAQLDFTADASHELRTPLSVIEGELSLALSSDSPPDPAVFERIGQESTRLKNIVDDLLWLARFDSAPPAPADRSVDLVEAAHGCFERFKGLAGANSIDLQFLRLGDESAMIVGNTEWMDKLTGVLVDNACKYAGVGGAVRIEAGRVGSRALLAVVDSGPGISEEERGRIFDRFRRGTGHERGHGLGLAIADSVVRSTSGRWKVEGTNAELGGARFEVSWKAAG